MINLKRSVHDSDGSWNTSDPVTINVGSAALPVSKMLPVGDKLWCSCHNNVKIFDTVALQFQVSDRQKWRLYYVGQGLATFS